MTKRIVQNRKPESERAAVVMDQAASPEATTPSVATPTDDFGKPHGQQISETLQLWILIPGLLVFLLIGKAQSDQ